MTGLESLLDLASHRRRKAEAALAAARRTLDDAAEAASMARREHAALGAEVDAAQAEFAGLPLGQTRLNLDRHAVLMRRHRRLLRDAAERAAAAEAERTAARRHCDDCVRALERLSLRSERLAEMAAEARRARLRACEARTDEEWTSR